MEEYIYNSGIVQKRQVTKQDLFAHAEPEVTALNMSSNQNGSNSSQSVTVGSFDEVNGVLTEEQCKALQKRSGTRVQILSREQAIEQAQLEKEALLAGMPEDALMIQGQGASQHRSKSATDGATLDVRIQRKSDNDLSSRDEEENIATESNSRIKANHNSV